MKKLIQYISPIDRLGDKNYSIFFPIFTNLFICIASEFFAYQIANNPEIVGIYIIFVNVASIIYFAFRDGIRGGLISTVIAISYYFYIIYSRQYTGNQRVSAIETTLLIGSLYLLVAGIIGWLKQTIDSLIEREANEKRRLRAILEQLPVGVVITDNTGKVVQANKQVELLLGNKIESDFVAGKDSVDNVFSNNTIITPSDSPIAQVLRTGRPVVGKEFTVDHGKGKHIHIKVSAAPIHNRRGMIFAAASIIHDITQQKEMEERKDDFVNMASHELKTPITSMKLYIDSLIKRMNIYNDERATKTLLSIQYQTERLQALVSNLLDVSRLQTGKLTFTAEKFNLDTLIQETVEELQATSDKELQYICTKPIKVYADKFRMYQVVTNLITNAIKYSPKGKTICVTLKKDNDTALISVKDYGIGIAKHQQKKIFTRLYQVVDDTEKTFPGFGMGLYISKEIVTRHKGQIWVDSIKGQGSTFYVRIPIKKYTS